MRRARRPAAPGVRGGRGFRHPTARMALTARSLSLGLVALLALGGCASADGDRGPDGPARADPSARASPPPVRLVVRKRVLVLTDRSRTVRRRDGSEAVRRLVTVVRYPGHEGGAPDRRRLPLIVFAHGYALTPQRYRALLYAWARAGYVVAAPVLPGENAAAPGGPNRADLLNQPADLRFVVARLLASSARSEGALAGAIDPARIAVAGHSDGGDTALAVAYDGRFRSRRVGAAVILAGADLPGIAPFAFPAGGPPLLAVQGGADAVNPPAATDAFYRRAPAPRLRLDLPGAGHFGPYMSQQPQLGVIERVTTAFLDRALKGAPVSRRRLLRLGRRAGVAALRVDGW